MPPEDDDEGAGDGTDGGAGGDAGEAGIDPRRASRSTRYAKIHHIREQ